MALSDAEYQRIQSLIEENAKVREHLKEFIDREDSLHKQRSMGGQHVGKSPSVSPSVLRKLKKIYEGESGL